jgi:hypothetical protein
MTTMLFFHLHPCFANGYSQGAFAQKLERGEPCDYDDLS